jgi:hypothetical protein
MGSDPLFPAHPFDERLKFRMVLRGPVLPAAVPVTAAGLLGQRIEQKHALHWLSGNHEALHALKIPARLLFRIGCRARSQGLEKTVSTRARMTRGAAGVAFTRAGEYWEDASFENLEVEPRLRRGWRDLLCKRRWP